MPNRCVLQQIDVSHAAPHRSYRRRLVRQAIVELHERKIRLESDDTAGIQRHRFQHWLTRSGYLLLVPDVGREREEATNLEWKEQQASFALITRDRKSVV